MPTAVALPPLLDPGRLDPGSVLRAAIAVWILFVLVRSGRNAWARRDLLVLVWARLRPAVWLRAGALAVVVLVVATALLELVPVLRHGLGSLVSFQGNAVFTPLEQAAEALGPAPATGPDWAVIALATGFLGLLAALLPWLAFLEEEAFRAGSEVLDLRRQATSALRFGLVHLVMLVPLGAALAIAIAGFAYGRVYRRQFLVAEPSDVPPVVLDNYRPTRRARRARSERLLHDARVRRDQGLEPRSPVLAAGEHVRAEDELRRRQAAGVLEATVLHTAFNTLVVALVWGGIVVAAATR